MRDQGNCLASGHDRSQCEQHRHVQTRQRQRHDLRAQLTWAGFGALFGDAKVDAETYVLLTEFATRIGLAFQIIDDVLDVTQSTETLGKPANSDEKAKKSTYTSLLGVKQAKSQAEDLLSEALSMLARAELKHDLLEEIAQTIVLRSH